MICECCNLKEGELTFGVNGDLLCIECYEYATNIITKIMGSQVKGDEE